MFSNVRARSSCRIHLVFAALLLGAAPLAAQGIQPPVTGGGQFPGGTWVNFESPHVKPLSIARLGSALAPQSFLLVCNTADSALEIFALNTAPSLPRAVARIRVGLDPVSVFWLESNQGGVLSGTIYTANMVGDSVSMIDLQLVAGVPVAKLLRTENVGDEPMDIELYPNGGSPILVVSLNSRNAVNLVDPATLATITPDPYFPLYVPIQYRGQVGGALLNGDAAINQPRTIQIATTTNPLTGLPAQFFFALGARGTHHDFPGVAGYANAFNETEIGFDLYWFELNTATPYVGGRKKLGTKNFNMTFDNSGACLVVSGDAANRAQKTKPNVAGEPTGFLRTLLHVLPSPADQAGAVLTRDLNRQTTTGGLGGVISPTSQSLSHCTDVAVFEQGQRYKVYVAAFNNDGLGVIDRIKPGGVWNTNPNTWLRTFVNLAKPGTAFAGPTSIAVKHATAGPNDPGDRVYVLNRFHNSVDVIDPATDAVIGNVKLQRNPTPPHIGSGREFLYSVKRGNDFNSCASCHFDGRLDGLRWDLSESSSTAPFALQLISALEDVLWLGQVDFSFTVPKGEFITQSLQGLVNYEVAAPFAQNTWFTNKPYHWDMDQANLSDFNGGGFQNLLGGPALTVAEMDAFQKFMNSVHYPPNYEESTDRKYRGTLGTANDPTNGTTAALGMKLFHIAPLDFPLEGRRSCVQCHSLPEGGNNLGTEAFFTTQLTGNSPPAPLPFESAPLRGIAQKEAVWLGYPVGSPVRALAFPFNHTNFSAGLSFLGASLHLDDPFFNPPVGAALEASNGLFHDGFRENIGDFIGSFFGAVFTGSDIAAINQFVREYDTGVAPMIGQAATVIGPGATPATIAAFMEQVRVVNAGLAVTGRIGGVTRGFWYDAFPAGTPPNTGSFVDVTSGTTFTPAALLALMTLADDTLVFQATPLGMDRRLASMGVLPALLTGSAPSAVQLHSMVPITVWEDVPSFENNWDPTHSNTPWQFNWNGSLGGPVMPEPWELKALRLMQKGYMGSTADRRHEPSRRFRVSGANIRPGAVLTIRVPQSTPPTSTVFLMKLPIYPSDKLAPNGNRIWETAVEADPLIAGMFAMGGYWAPGIDPTNTSTSVLLRTVVDLINESSFNPSTYFSASVWNQYTIDVTNEDGTTASATNQVITIEPAGFVH